MEDRMRHADRRCMRQAIYAVFAFLVLSSVLSSAPSSVLLLFRLSMLHLLPSLPRCEDSFKTETSNFRTSVLTEKAGIPFGPGGFKPDPFEPHLLRTRSSQSKSWTRPKT